jgi:hypothetical protein
MKRESLRSSTQSLRKSPPAFNLAEFLTKFESDIVRKPPRQLMAPPVRATPWKKEDWVMEVRQSARERQPPSELREWQNSYTVDSRSIVDWVKDRRLWKDWGIGSDVRRMGDAQSRKVTA